MECFTVYSNKIEGRFDVESNLKRVKSSKDFLNFDNFHSKKLGEIALLKRGPFGSSIKKEIFVEKSPDSYQVYEQYNAINNSPEWARYFISEKDFQRLNSFSVQENDILMSCSGTIGKLTVIPRKFHEGVINQALLRIRLNIDVNLKYFVIIFLYIIEKLIEGNEFAYGSAIRNVVSVKELKEIKIPLPPFSIQNHIVQIMDNAYKIKKQKEVEAQQLLVSFEGLLREEKILNLKRIQKQKMFSINLEDLDGAFNPERYANQIQYDSSVDWVQINNIGSIFRNTFTPEKTNPEEMYSLMRIDDLDNNPISAVTRNVKGKSINGIILKVQINDVLISRLGPTIENKKFILAPKSNLKLISSNEFICLRCNEKNNPYFILHLLKTDFYNKLMIQKTRGATPSRRRLSHKDFGELPFPQIDISIQNKIAEEVKRRMQKAERLQKEAKQLLEEAKEKVEKVIENPLEISETQPVLRSTTKGEPEIIIPFTPPSKSVSPKTPVKIKYKEYQMLDSSIKKLVQQIGDGSIIKRFEKTPIPKSKTDVVCPHFLELKWATGCPYDCSWCYLKGTFRFLPYKANPHIKDFDKIEKHIKTFLEYVKTPEILNTGELADSLMLEGKNKSFIKFIVPFFENQNKHKILFLTKSNKVENLLSLTSHRQVIVSFSLNAIPVAQRWEKKAPSVEDRIKAAETLYKQGHEVRIRIDPMIPVENWEQLYTDLIDHIFNSFIPERITLGSLRGLQSTINGTSDKSWVKYLSERSNWGRKIDINLRLAMYKTIISYLKEKHKYNEVALCKETLAIWDILNMDYKNIKCNCVW